MVILAWRTLLLWTLFVRPSGVHITEVLLYHLRIRTHRVTALGCPSRTKFWRSDFCFAEGWPEKICSRGKDIHDKFMAIDWYKEEDTIYNIGVWKIYWTHVYHCIFNTLADSATPYLIGLWRKVKSCDQKHGCLLKIFFPGLQLYGVALRDTVHFDHVTSYFLLCPLLYGVSLSDSVLM